MSGADDTQNKIELEILPEMIEAGLNALRATGAIEHPNVSNESVVRSVFTAMISASSFAVELRFTARLRVMDDEPSAT